MTTSRWILGVAAIACAACSAPTAPATHTTDTPTQKPPVIAGNYWSLEGLCGSGMCWSTGFAIELDSIGHATHFQIVTQTGGGLPGTQPFIDTISSEMLESTLTDDTIHFAANSPAGNVTYTGYRVSDTLYGVVTSREGLSSPTVAVRR